MAPPAIETKGLTKRYGEFVAVDRLDLVVERGEIFGLLGPNGAGKTTTIMMLLGLSEPSAGSARVVGLDPTRNPLEIKQRVGYLPDAAGFYDDLTGRQNLRYTARLNRIPPKEAERRLDALLEEVGMTDRADDPVGAYSRGMRQRLGIADALVKEPEILILDEPTVAIDPEGVVEILQLIAALPEQRGVTVMLSSHLLAQVQEICTRIGIFVRGQLVAKGTIAELGHRVRDTVLIEVGVVAGDPADALASVAGVTHVERHDGLHLVSADRDVRAGLAEALVKGGFLPTHLRVREEELSDIYHRYFMGFSA
ncbi:MAG: ABC transporter ATP-binding protein [Acidimicrobiales bacterium]